MAVLTIPDGLDTDHVAAGAQLFASAVTVILVFIAWKQIRALQLERSDRMRPMLLLDAESHDSDCHTLRVVNHGPGPAVDVEMNLEPCLPSHHFTNLEAWPWVTSVIGAGQKLECAVNIDGLSTYLAAQPPRSDSIPMLKSLQDIVVSCRTN